MTRLGVDWALLAMSYALLAASDSVIFLILAFAASGVQLHRLALLGHEGAHRLLSRGKANDLIANFFCLYPFGVTVAGYRAWHFDHHRLVGTPADPELVFKRGPRYRAPKRRLAFVAMFARDLLGAGVGELLRLCWCCRPRSPADALPLIVYWAAALILVQLFDAWRVLLAHVLAVATVFWALFRLRSWCEHVAADGPDHTHRFSARSVVAYAVYPHGTWLHWEHHRYPAVPCYNLPALRASLPPRPVLSVAELFDSFGRDRASVRRSSEFDGQ